MFKSYYCNNRVFCVARRLRRRKKYSFHIFFDIYIDFFAEMHYNKAKATPEVYYD